MKHVHFILQAKGGVGKSFLTYLYALTHENNSGCLFIDLDNSTQTSDRQLAFLRGQKRVAKLSLFNERDKQDRQLLPKSLLQLAAQPFGSYFLDFGAPESEQFPALLRRDLSASMLKQVEEHTHCNYVFHVVIGGNTAFKSCVEYLVSLVGALEGLFSIVVHLNEYNFVGPAHEEQRKSLTVFCHENGLTLQPFGRIDADSEVGKQIVHYAQLGKGLDEYGFLERLVMEREINQLRQV